MASSINPKPKRTKERLCLGLTEQGKLYAIENNVEEALRHYREALRLAKDCKNADVFFHHTTQCIMELLEVAGNYDLVIEYCTRSEAHYADIETDFKNTLLSKQRAANVERLGIAQLLSGDTVAAKQSFAHAIDISPDKRPISATVSDWLARGYTIAPKQVKSLQSKHEYFIVKKSEVNMKWAIVLPKEIGRRPQI